GRQLREAGRARVIDFVRNGGGYIGICAGAYLAMQGGDTSQKLLLVAARNRTGGAWRRGVAGVWVEAEGRPRFRLFYANGPIFTPDTTGGAPYVELARYAGEVFSRARGTGPGEMLGTPAIVAAASGQGRVLLFSPNPILGGQGVAHPELMRAGLRWTAAGGAVPDGLEFGDVFPG
ncbi:MAG TPA: BPL-N domain-containing protein, partial [Nannocystis sp.]